ncbi:MAG: hypothetical protein NT023_09520 [Armatimonadetes bacterium]|nr:hypothetical protein [Armatimonadota bacterium]
MQKAIFSPFGSRALRGVMLCFMLLGLLVGTGTTALAQTWVTV